MASSGGALPADFRSSCFTCGNDCTFGSWDKCAGCRKNYTKCFCEPAPWMLQRLREQALDLVDKTPISAKRGTHDSIRDLLDGLYHRDYDD